MNNHAYIQQEISQTTKTPLTIVTPLETSQNSEISSATQGKKLWVTIGSRLISFLKKAAAKTKDFFRRPDADLRAYYDLEYRNEQPFDPWKHSVPIRWYF